MPASLLAFTNTGQLQPPTGDSFELALHWSVEPLSHTRAFSKRGAYCASSVLQSVAPPVPAVPALPAAPPLPLAPPAPALDPPLPVLPPTLVLPAELVLPALAPGAPALVSPAAPAPEPPAAALLPPSAGAAPSPALPPMPAPLPVKLLPHAAHTDTPKHASPSKSRELAITPRVTQTPQRASHCAHLAA